uniref:Uncharacterized protein n=1 Tax=Panagrolaimus sp. JU765 TaxID=591449 RepID=A0AC34Q175_9BILA
LLNQNDHSCEKQYLELLERLPRSVIFREFLIINGGFKTEKKDAPPKWLIESISSRLTNYLLQKNGLFHLFLAFDDLGGDSFWQNSVALSSVAKLLSTKPKQSESYPKYLNFIFGEFLEIMKDNKFGTKISLLFALTITQLYSIDPLLVEIQLVDKLIPMDELLLE